MDEVVTSSLEWRENGEWRFFYQTFLLGAVGVVDVTLLVVVCTVVGTKRSEVGEAGKIIVWQCRYLCKRRNVRCKKLWKLDCYSRPSQEQSTLILLYIAALFHAHVFMPSFQSSSLHHKDTNVLPAHIAFPFAPSMSTVVGLLRLDRA